MKLLSGSPVRLWLSAAVLFSGASISAADNLEEAKNAGLGHLDWLSERQQKIVKDLEATVIGKLMQADGGKPLPRKQVLGQADRMPEDIKAFKAMIKESYGRAKEGAMGIGDFNDGTHGTVAESLYAHWDVVQNATTMKLRLLQQENGLKAEGFVKRLQNREPREAVAADEEAWFAELEKKYKAVAQGLAAEQHVLKINLEVWGKQNPWAKSIYSGWREDELDIGRKPGQAASTFQKYLDAQRWLWSPTAGDRSHEFLLEKYMSSVPERELAKLGAGRPDYPIRLVLPNMEVQGVELFGPCSEWSAKVPVGDLDPDYWKKTEVDIPLSPPLGAKDIVLAFYGKNFLSWLGERPLLRNPSDENIKYELIGITKLTEPDPKLSKIAFKAVRRIHSRTEKSVEANLEVIFVRASLSRWTATGLQEFDVGELTCEWLLPRNLNEGVVGIFRKNAVTPINEYAALKSPLEWAYDGDRAVAEVRALSSIAENRKVRLRLIRIRGKESTEVLLNGERWIEAKRVEKDEFHWPGFEKDTYEYVFQSPAFRIRLGEKDDPNDNVIHCHPKDVIVPTLEYPGPVMGVNSHHCTFYTKPDDLGVTFLLALEEAAVLRGIDLGDRIGGTGKDIAEKRRKWITEVTAKPIFSVTDGGWFPDISSEEGGRSKATETITLGDLAILQLVSVDMRTRGNESLRHLRKQLAIVRTFGEDGGRNPSAYLALDRIYDAVKSGGHTKLLAKFHKYDGHAGYGYIPVAKWHSELDWQPGTEVPRQASTALQELILPIEMELANLEKWNKEFYGLNAKTPEKLFRKTGLGAHRWLSLIGGRMVKPEFSEDGKDQWWRQDDLAAGLLINAAGKAHTLAAKKAEGDAHDQVITLGLALVTFPFSAAEGALGLLGHGLGLVGSSEALWDAYQFNERGNSEMETDAMSLCLNAYYVGPRRAAELKIHKEGWATFANVIFSGLGMIPGTVALPENLRVAKESMSLEDAFYVLKNPRTAMRSRWAEVGPAIARAKANAKAAWVAEEHVLSALSAVCLTDLMKAEGSALARIVITPESLAGEIVITERVAATCVEIPATELIRARGAMEEYLARGGDSFTPGAKATLKDLMEQVARQESLSPQVLRTSVKATLNEKAFLPKPGYSWEGYAVGRYLGNGVYSMVYELGDDLVLKVGLLDAKTNIATFARSMEGAELLELSGIPQLKIKGNLSRRFERTCALVQERMPEGSILLSRAERIPVDVVKPSGTLMEMPAQRVQGIDYADLFKQTGRTDVAPATLGQLAGKAMPSEYAEALCKLYKDLVAKGLIWTDGHLGNIVFVKEGDTWVAKIIDSDFIWKWGENFKAIGVRGTSAGKLMENYYLALGGRIDPKKWAQKMQSLAGSTHAPSAVQKAAEGVHLMPSAEVFMMKMLEFHGFVHYDRGLRKWVSGSMNIEDAKKFFQNIDAPELIDIKFSSLRMSDVAFDSDMKLAA